MAKNKITVKPLISFMSKGSWRGSKKKSKWPAEVELDY